MKRMVTNPELNLTSFELLSENEMLEVRGGTDTRPITRDRDQFDELD